MLSAAAALREHPMHVREYRRANECLLSFGYDDDFEVDFKVLGPKIEATPRLFTGDITKLVKELDIYEFPPEDGKDEEELAMKGHILKQKPPKRKIYKTEEERIQAMVDGTLPRPVFRAETVLSEKQKEMMRKIAEGDRLKEEQGRQRGSALLRAPFQQRSLATQARPERRERTPPRLPGRFSHNRRILVQRYFRDEHGRPLHSVPQRRSPLQPRAAPQTLRFPNQRNGSARQSSPALSNSSTNSDSSNDDNVEYEYSYYDGLALVGLGAAEEDPFIAGLHEALRCSRNYPSPPSLPDYVEEYPDDFPYDQMREKDTHIDEMEKLNRICVWVYFCCWQKPCEDACDVLPKDFTEVIDDDIIDVSEDSMSMQGLVSSPRTEIDETSVLNMREATAMWAKMTGIYLQGGEGDHKRQYDLHMKNFVVSTDFRGAIDAAAETLLDQYKFHANAVEVQERIQQWKEVTIAQLIGNYAHDVATKKVDLKRSLEMPALHLSQKRRREEAASLSIVIAGTSGLRDESDVQPSAFSPVIPRSKSTETEPEEVEKEEEEKEEEEEEGEEEEEEEEEEDEDEEEYEFGFEEDYEFSDEDVEEEEDA